MKHIKNETDLGFVAKKRIINIQRQGDQDQLGVS